MKSQLKMVLACATLVIASCTTTKNLTYLSNLSDTTEGQYFPYELSDYQVQPRDILYIDIKVQNPEGKVEDVLRPSGSLGQAYMQNESNQFLLGYNVDEAGNISLPILGIIHVEGKTLPEIRNKLDSLTIRHFKLAWVDCKLLSFKFTVLGEVRTPGTYVNFNNYLTVFEALGRAGGVSDYGVKDRLLVIRSTQRGSQTYRINLQDKSILSSEAYFLQPNDVVIIESQRHKTFNMNLPTVSFIITATSSLITTTLLLINYFK